MNAFFCLSLVGFTLVSAGCQRVISINETTFSAEVRQVAPQSVLDSLTKYGVPIHPGLEPPTLDGVYFLNPNLLINSNYANDRDSLNIKIYAPYKYRFREYNPDKLTVKLDYKSFKDNAGTQLGGDMASGLDGYLSGNGSKFTLFIEVTGTSQKTIAGKIESATYTALDTYSGELTPMGIRGIIKSFYMKRKTDPANILVPVGTIRVFRDEDGFSEKVSTFRQAASEGGVPIPTATYLSIHDRR